MCDWSAGAYNPVRAHWQPVVPALSRCQKPEGVIAKELNHLREGRQMTPDLVFRDPYMLDFLGLPDGYSERDLESAILREMERFCWSWGRFTFVARQKRISVGRTTFYLTCCSTTGTCAAWWRWS